MSFSFVLNGFCLFHLNREAVRNALISYYGLAFIVYELMGFFFSFGDYCTDIKESSASLVQL